jgi:hypothetical protein
MSRTKHDPDRDEHGHFVKNKMQHYRWLNRWAIGGTVIVLAIGIALLAR